MTNETLLNEIGQCKEWYQTLGNYKQKLNQLKTELYAFAPGKTDKDILVEVEHYHNQFHIQLINIHDLQHELKPLINEFDRHPDQSVQIPFKDLKGKFDFLINDLDKLEGDFHAFIKA